MPFLMLFKIQLMYFQNLFTEFKDLDSLLSYNPAKFLFWPKAKVSQFEILLFWLLLNFTNAIWDFHHFHILALDEARNVKNSNVHRISKLFRIFFTLWASSLVSLNSVKRFWKYISWILKSIKIPISDLDSC